MFEKKMILMFVVFLLLTCFSCSAFAADKVKVNVAVTVGPNAAAAQAIKPIFEVKNPDIEVNITEIPWTDIYQIQLLDFMSKKGNFDLVMQSTSFFGEYVLDGFLEPLEEYFNDVSLIDKTAFNLDDFNPNVLKAVGSYEGKLYALPYMYFPQIMVYRSDLLKTIGWKVPATFDEYSNIVKKFSEIKGIYGTSIIGIKGGAGGNVYAWGPYLFGFGGYYIDQQGKPAFNSPEAVKALEYYAGLYKYSPSEAINMGTDQVTSAFGAGNVGIILMDADNAMSLLDPKYTEFSDKTSFDLVPKSPGSEAGSPLLGAWSWAISKFSNNKKAAFKVLTAFMGNDPEIVDAYVKNGIHPRLSVLNKYSSTYPNYALVAKELPNTKTVPVIPNWPQIRNPGGSHFQSHPGQDEPTRRFK
ncbi:MAG: sugar ABC transporter substrate-binding protein [Candidatus Atribacteria bacterium]|nr:sugar ABC transporter substrate-binding protein [Candidatus Atribacteria bacterium]